MAYGSLHFSTVEQGALNVHNLLATNDDDSSASARCSIGESQEAFKSQEETNSTSTDHQLSDSQAKSGETDGNNEPSEIARPYAWTEIQTREYNAECPDANNNYKAASSLADGSTSLNGVGLNVRPDVNFVEATCETAGQGNTDDSPGERAEPFLPLPVKEREHVSGYANDEQIEVSITGEQEKKTETMKAKTNESKAAPTEAHKNSGGHSSGTMEMAKCLDQAFLATQPFRNLSKSFSSLSSYEKCFTRMGNSGLGAWRTGSVSSDVIIHNLVVKVRT